MQKTTKSNISEYKDVLNRIYYIQGDTRKMRQDVFQKEITAACHYGAVCALQNLLLNKDYSHEELIGEAQLKMLESYGIVRSLLKARMPKIEIEDIYEANN